MIFDIKLPKLPKLDFYRFFSGNNMILFLILCGMVHNFVHNASLYNSIKEGESQGFFVVLIFDIGLIVLMLNEKAREAQFLAIILGVINLLYWDFLKDIYQYDKVLEDPIRLKQVLAKLIYTLVFTFFLHRYSKLYVDKSTALPKLEHLKAENEHLKADREHNRAIIELLNITIEDSKKQYEDLSNQCSAYQVTILELKSQLKELKPWREKWIKITKSGEWFPDVNLPIDSFLRSYRATKSISETND